jgi:hypothetical protein
MGGSEIPAKASFRPILRARAGNRRIFATIPCAGWDVRRRPIEGWTAGGKSEWLALMNPFYLAGLLWMAGLVAVHAEPVIHSIQKVNQYVWVDNAWSANSPCYRVSLSVTEDLAGAAGYKAYFFNVKKELVGKADRPADVSLKLPETYREPSELKKGKRHDVYFAVPKNLQQGEKRVSTIVVIFKGDGKSATKVFPAAPIEDFPLPGGK